MIEEFYFTIPRTRHGQKLLKVANVQAIDKFCMVFKFEMFEFIFGVPTPHSFVIRTTHKFVSIKRTRDNFAHCKIVTKKSKIIEKYTMNYSAMKKETN